jgi:hypothetical protein
MLLAGRKWQANLLGTQALSHQAFTPLQCPQQVCGLLHKAAQLADGQLTRHLWVPAAAVWLQVPSLVNMQTPWLLAAAQCGVAAAPNQHKQGGWQAGVVMMVAAAAATARGTSALLHTELRPTQQGGRQTMLFYIRPRPGREVAAAELG